MIHSEAHCQLFDVSCLQELPSLNGHEHLSCVVEIAASQFLHIENMKPIQELSSLLLMSSPAVDKAELK